MSVRKLNFPPKLLSPKEQEENEIFSMLHYMFYIITVNYSDFLDDKILFVGDSNMKYAYNATKDFDLFNKYNIAVNSRSGRCARHLQSIYPEIVWFKYIVIIVGNNDFNNTDNAQLIKYYKDLRYHIPELNIKQYVKFVELLPRKDHNAEAVKAINRKLKESLASDIIPNNSISPCHFRDDEHYHLKPEFFGKFAKLMANCCRIMMEKVVTKEI